MSLSSLAVFVALSAVAAYVQTVTGFAFGLILMTGVALGGVMPLPDAAAVVSALTLVNVVQMMSQGWRHIAWREWRLCVVASLPMIFVGVAALNWLAAERVDLLRLILGAAVAAASLSLLKPIRPGATQPAGWTYNLAGALSGLMSGLFSAGGPPLAFRFYTSSLPVAAIRETLVSVYALNAIVRLGVVFASDVRPPVAAWWGLIAVPVVMATTAAARRWPPPMAPARLRMVVAALLAGSALALAWPALARVLAA
ncbi:MAG: TSUP family transporter [Rhodoblastus sp.]|nr:MAG: TSUP family transporter [Rhodoblastus sp.]